MIRQLFDYCNAIPKELNKQLNVPHVIHYLHHHALLLKHYILYLGNVSLFKQTTHFFSLSNQNIVFFFNVIEDNHTT